MDRKWRCERNARGPRGPPGLFPAVCPCEAVCAGFPTRMASLPLPALKPPCRSLCGGCAEETERTPHRRDEGKTGEENGAGKSGGAFGSPPQATPSRNAGREDGFPGFIKECGTILHCCYDITFVAVA